MKCALSEEEVTRKKDELRGSRVGNWQTNALWMADAVIRIVTLFQLLKTRIIFFAIISRWPVFESKVRIVYVMVCNSSLRDMIAYSAYRLSKSCGMRG